MGLELACLSVQRRKLASDRVGTIERRQHHPKRQLVAIGKALVDNAAFEREGRFEHAVDPFGGHGLQIRELEGRSLGSDNRM